MVHIARIVRQNWPDLPLSLQTLRCNNSGQFFITPNCETKILDEELGKDGILGYESPHGYFITHDIYEEWALEKIIEIEFVRKPSVQTFFDGIGESLPIRRSFRKWVSENLLAHWESP
jgi:hypothetical protein